MSHKPCRQCGAISPLDSRFCRTCGAALRYASGEDTIVSPHAATVPLPRVDRVAHSDPPSGAFAAPIEKATGDKKIAPEANRRALLLALAAMVVAVATAFSVLAALDKWGGTRGTSPDAEAGVTPPTDLQAESSRLMIEAERLLAAGEVVRATETAREAVRLDDRNARAHYDLAAALELSGRRGEALVFYEAAAALAPDSPLAWQRLADAQLAEGNFAQAAQSYERLLALTPDDAGAQLRLAAALREARLAAQRPALGDSSTPDAQAAPETVPAVSDERSAVIRFDDDDNAGDAEGELTARADTDRAARPTDANARTDAAPAAAALTSSMPAPQRFERAVALYAADRPAALAEFRSLAATIPDAHYFLGLARTENRAPGAMHRAELLAALTDFQIAQARGTRFRAQAARYADQLGREYDRRRKG